MADWEVWGGHRTGMSWDLNSVAGTTWHRTPPGIGLESQAPRAIAMLPQVWCPLVPHLPAPLSVAFIKKDTRLLGPQE